MAKAALNMMTLSGARDYARDGILMNSADTGTEHLACSLAVIIIAPLVLLLLLPWCYMSIHLCFR